MQGQGEVLVSELQVRIWGAGLGEKGWGCSCIRLRGKE